MIANENTVYERCENINRTVVWGFGGTNIGVPVGVNILVCY